MVRDSSDPCSREWSFLLGPRRTFLNAVGREGSERCLGASQSWQDSAHPQTARPHSLVPEELLITTSTCRPPASTCCAPLPWSQPPPWRKALRSPPSSSHYPPLSSAFCKVPLKKLPQVALQEAGHLPLNGGKTDPGDVCPEQQGLACWRQASVSSGGSPGTILVEHFDCVAVTCVNIHGALTLMPLGCHSVAGTQGCSTTPAAHSPLSLPSRPLP